eukprot:CAMPEP_0179423802 /NCGR_PEP_ID=MMETSP0799-20121207/11220_1 /TAXON_ID=46947 /ORGANISM="Geminigera cryophila, Strain CCMP2564" /LENGTH=104 /DNA_ID=CAMNT_0021198153 /DNA_START=122 /DNA_END=432 /DNA_ORIENTATION=-
MTVEARLVGSRIIGPKRSKLLRLQVESGVRIMVPKTGTHGKDIQILSLYGMSAQVDAARRRIEQLLASPSDPAATTASVTRLECPSSFAAAADAPVALSATVVA